MPGYLRRHIRRRPHIVNIVLFIVTVFTTTLMGGFLVNRATDSWIVYFLSGWVFSLPLMTILLVHEMGHYVMGRLHNMDVSPPYFIPAPPPIPLGTFGALIRIRSPIPDRTALIKIGAWGPVAGSLTALPLLLLGMGLSETKPPNPDFQGFALGTSVIQEIFLYLIWGGFSESMDTVVVFHPTAIAAWAGLLVTALNLLPIGQLDGGHVVYALFGPKVARLIGFGVFAALVPLGVFLWPGWLFFGLIVLFLGLKHPAPVDPYTPPDHPGKLVGWAAIALFVLTFVPAPVSLLE